MKKGQSYITLTDKDEKHPLIRALKKKGLKDIELVYASHWATDSGWTLIQSNKGAVWLGYTISESLTHLTQNFKNLIQMNNEQNLNDGTTASMDTKPLVSSVI